MDERTTDLGLADPSVAGLLAPLLVARRRALGRSLRALASASKGRWSKRDLAEAEAGRRPFNPAEVADLAALYEVDVSAVLPRRHPLSVGDGVIRAGHIEACFVPGERASLLSAYIGLLHRLRGGAPLIHVELRRADVVVLAEALGDDPDDTIGELASMIRADGRSTASIIRTEGAGVVVLPLRGGVGRASNPDAHRWGSVGEQEMDSAWVQHRWGFDSEFRVDLGLGNITTKTTAPDYSPAIEREIMRLARRGGVGAAVEDAALARQAAPAQVSAAAPVPTAVSPPPAPESASRPRIESAPRPRVENADPLTLLLGLPAPRSRGASVVDEAFGAPALDFTANDV